jgi:hypothetical protein
MHVTGVGMIRGIEHKTLVGKAEGKKSLERPGHKWEDLKKIWWDGVDCIHVSQDGVQYQAVVNMMMNLWIL